MESKKFLKAVRALDFSGKKIKDTDDV